MDALYDLIRIVIDAIWGQGSGIYMLYPMLLTLYSMI